MYNTAVFDKIGCPQRVVEHCLAVCRLALSISEKVRIEIDRDLIHDGAMYHDIGRCMTHGIEHAVIGARIASEMGLPEKVVRIIERHIGAGITAEEAERLGLPKKDYIPQTPEEKIVSYADNLIKGTQVVSFEEAMERFRYVLGENHLSIRMFEEMHKEIQSWMIL